MPLRMSLLLSSLVLTLVASLAQAQSFEYATFFGGSVDDSLTAVASDDQGNVYVAGNTRSLNFPATSDLSASRQVERSSDGGVSWDPVVDLPTTDISSLAVASSDPPMLYATSGTTFYRSDDSGVSWQASEIPLTNAPNDAVRAYPLYPVLATTNDAGIVYVAVRYEDLMRTLDGGQTWHPINAGLPADESGRQVIDSVAADPFEPHRIWVAALGGLYQSDDAGEHWNEAALPEIGDIIHVAFAPGAPGTVFVFSKYRFLRSTDGGESWTAPGILPAGLQSRPYIIRIAVPNPNLLYAEQPGALWRSLDGGATWVEGSPVPAANRKFTDLVIDRSSPENLLATTSEATYRSTDGAQTWQQVRDCGGLIALLPNGVLVLASERRDDAFIAKLGPDGDRILFATLLGGAGDEEVADIAVDAQGQVTVIGTTESFDFPITRGSLTYRQVGAVAPFIARLNAQGDALVYSTGLPAERMATSAKALAVDAAGNAYVAGQTLSGFPTTANAAQPQVPSTNQHDLNAFAVKVNSFGEVVYSTLIGGAGDERGAVIAADDSGAAWVAGSTQSEDFPVSGGGAAGHGGEDYDAFLVKIDPSGTAFQFATRLGGTEDDDAGGVAIDDAGDVYVTGTTEGNGFPTTEGVYQSTLRSHQCTVQVFPFPVIVTAADAFVTKLSAGGEIIYSTLVGGGCAVEPVDLAVDATGRAMFAAGTTGEEFPLINPIQMSGSCGANSFVIAQLTPDASGLALSSYLDAGVPSLAPGLEGRTWVGGGACSGSTVTADALQPGAAGGYLVRIGPTPVATLDLQSVANAFGGPQGVISPGGLIELRGPGIGPEGFYDFGWTPAEPLPTVVEETHVFIDQRAAPIVKASRDRLVVVAPQEIAGKTTVLVLIVRGSERSDRLPVTVADSVPALLTRDGSGTGQLTARHASTDGSLNSPDNPAARGSLVTLYATGLGLTEPTQEAGAVATGNQVSPVAPITISIGGQSVPVRSVSSMPGFLNGLFQVWVRLPEELTPGIVEVRLESPPVAPGWTLAVD